MALDATARETNFRDSVKKFFEDNIDTAEGIPVTFDVTLSMPDYRDRKVDRWVAVSFGPIQLGTLASAMFKVTIATRQDAEGFKQAQVRDTVMGYLTDDTKTDSMARIPLYRSHQDPAAWTLLDGGIIIQDIIEGESWLAEDKTKVKTLDVRARWGSKL